MEKVQQGAARFVQRHRFLREPVPFDHGLYRIVREHTDPALRARHGPVQVDEPRTSRTQHRMGIGEPVRLSPAGDGAP